MSDEQQTQQATDDPSGPGWRDVTTGDVTQSGDMVRADDNFPLGRWVLAEPGETVTDDDIVRRRIEQQQPSDSEPETIEDLQERLNAALKSNNERGDLVQRQHDLLREAEERNEKLVRQVELTQQENGELQGLVSQAERSGEQVNAELQQLREQLQTLMVNYDRTKTQLWDAVEARQKAERELATETKCYRDSFKANHKAGQQQVLDRLQKWLRPVLEVVADHPDETSILAVSVLEFLPQIASRLIEE